MSGDLEVAMVGQLAPHYLMIQYVHIYRGWAATLGGPDTAWPRDALRLEPVMVEPEQGRPYVRTPTGWMVASLSQGRPFVCTAGTSRPVVLHSVAGWWNRLQALMDKTLWCQVLIDSRGKDWEGWK